MVDMGDDAEVADIFHHTGNLNRSLYPKGQQFRYCPFWTARTASYTQSAGKDILDPFGGAKPRSGPTLSPRRRVDTATHLFHTFNKYSLVPQ